MRVTQKLRERLKTDVPQVLSAAMNTRLPRAVLQSRAAKRSARRLLWILERVDMERLAVRPIATLRDELRKFAAPESHPSERGEQRGEEVAREPAAGEHGASTASTGAPTEKPMPEMIRTTGGRRVPASVAHRAVAQSGVEFKPKKGKK